jgi:hypothetical protein
LQWLVFYDETKVKDEYFLLYQNELFIEALVIAIPVSWWALNKWLESFAYRIHLSPLIFIFTGIIVR